MIHIHTKMAQKTSPILKKLFSGNPTCQFRPFFRSITYMPRPGSNPITPTTTPRAVTLIPGDGIGPLVTNGVEQVISAMKAPVTFEKFENVHGDMKKIPDDVIESIKRNKVCLKGGLMTPMGGGVNSLNVVLRKELDLFVSLVNCCNFDGLVTRHENVDIVVIRENTEGEYSGLEHEVVPGVVESLKVITKFCSERIAQYAFEYAHLNNRKTVTAVHKANIMKLADGLFLESCREIAKRYPDIKYNEIIVDNCCMQLVSKPEQFDVMVTPNLYGNLVANVAAGIAGGTGVMPGGNVGTEFAIFEQGASAGNVGKPKMVEKKRANPIALFLSSAMMLRHIQLPDFADRLETAVKHVIFEGKYRTKDLGGSSTTQEVTDAVISALEGLA
uniref:isocitrate dehydrogenase [NAD] regulatory subunit 3, mitochondrial-like n=1 Tax=Erigeron canadensis TaxID=72917 RepID=UPI001CB90B4F|nr:isocitrate dehydrogenase [NAD] regulatory subunit 3, mitochondrial-like [Erigeron canadensis]